MTTMERVPVPVNKVSLTAIIICARVVLCEDVLDAHIGLVPFAVVKMVEGDSYWL